MKSASFHALSELELGADEVRILAVAHQKRRPRYWTGRR
jgi:hypothetical protein